MPQTYLTAAPVSTVTQTRLPPFVALSTVKRMALVTRSSWVSGVLPAVILCAMTSADILAVAGFCAPWGSVETGATASMSLKCLISSWVAASFDSSGMKSPAPMWLVMSAIAAALSMMMLFDRSGAGLDNGRWDVVCFRREWYVRGKVLSRMA